MDRLRRLGRHVQILRPVVGEASGGGGLAAAVSLRSGLKMPLFGLGVFQMSKPFDGRDDEAGECTAACNAALDLGYQLIDTAQGYNNEEEVGAALKGRPRDSVFVVTKLTGANHGAARTIPSLRESLERLNLDYVDCFLVHNPKGGLLVETWQEMLKAKALGLALSVGVSNFGVEQLQGLSEAGLELPEVNQIELHCWLQQPQLVDYCVRNGIALMGYRPTANGFRFGMQQQSDSGNTHPSK